MKTSNVADFARHLSRTTPIEIDGSSLMRRGKRKVATTAIWHSLDMKLLNRQLISSGIDIKHECSWVGNSQLLKSAIYSSKTNNRFRRPPVISTRTPWVTISMIRALAVFVVASMIRAASFTFTTGRA